MGGQQESCLDQSRIEDAPVQCLRLSVQTLYAASAQHLADIANLNAPSQLPK